MDYYLRLTDPCDSMTFQHLQEMLQWNDTLPIKI